MKILMSVCCVLLLFSGSMIAVEQADVLAQRLQQHVVTICGVKPARNHENVASLNVVRDYIHESFTQSQLRVTLQEYTVAGRAYANVVGCLDLGRAQTIIVGAHYDVCHDQQGADDNASAVAGLLELAQLLSQMAAQEPEKLRCNIEFAAYTLEEPPYFGTQHMGSYVHAQSVQQRMVAEGAEGTKMPLDVAYMVCLEMIGYYSDAEGSQEYPSPLMYAVYPRVGNFIAVVGNEDSREIVGAITATVDAHGGIPCEALVAPAGLMGVDFSDHFNYWDIGVPAVMITDTAFYRNEHYHKKTDTPDTLDYTKMAAVVLGLEGSFYKP